MRRSMLDSGANARVTYVQHLDRTQSVGSVTLASGESAPCSTFIGLKGMPNVQIVGNSDNDILPLFWLIERNCKMADDFLTLYTPKGRPLPIQVGDDELLYLASKCVEMLFEDLPDAEEEGRSGTAASMVVKVAFSMRLRVAALKVNPIHHESRCPDIGHAGLGESVGDIGSAGATAMGHVVGRENEDKEMFSKSLRKTCSPVVLTFCLKFRHRLWHPSQRGAEKNDRCAKKGSETFDASSTSSVVMRIVLLQT